MSTPTTATQPRRDRHPRPTGPLSDTAVGAAIRDRRCRLGLHQETLADRGGIDRAVVSRIERGERPCRVTELVALPGALDIAAVTLLTAARQDPKTAEDAT